MQFEEVKAIIKDECDKHGVEFFHSEEPTVLYRDGVESNGFFTEDGGDGKPKLAVGTNSNTLETMVHEYCHMQQYLEDAEVWQNIHGREHIWRWIEGLEEFPEEVLDESFKAFYLIEVDCEQRSIQKHREWNTGINEEEYIQKANAYTMFYFFMREHRVWYRAGQEPYTIEEVWRNMPKTFTFDRVSCYLDVYHLFEQCI